MDGLLLMLFGIVPALIALLLAETSGLTPQVGGTVSGATAVALWLTTTAYLTITQARPGERNGQTVGKRQYGLRVVRADGAPLGRRRAFSRAAVMALISPGGGYPLAALAAALSGGAISGSDVRGDLFGLVVGLSLAVAARSALRRSLVDHFTGTVVVEERRVLVSAGGEGRPAPSAPGAAGSAFVELAPSPRALAIGVAIAGLCAYLLTAR